MFPMLNQLMLMELLLMNSSKSEIIILDEMLTRMGMINEHYLKRVL